MQAIEVAQALPGVETLGRQSMQTPEEVTAMLRLAQAGVGVKRIAVEAGVLEEHGQALLARRRLDRLSEARAGQPARGSGELARRAVSPAPRQRRRRASGSGARARRSRCRCARWSERLQPLRREFRAETVATIRFETAPGEQLQIDFGTVTVSIGGEPTKVKLFVATLGYSRRPYVALFEHERQSAWLAGHRGGVSPLRADCRASSCSTTPGR